MNKRNKDRKLLASSQCSFAYTWRNKPTSPVKNLFLLTTEFPPFVKKMPIWFTWKAKENFITCLWYLARRKKIMGILGSKSKWMIGLHRVVCPFRRYNFCKELCQRIRTENISSDSGNVIEHTKSYLWTRRNLDSLEEMDRANEHAPMQVVQVLLYTCFYTKFIRNTGIKYVWVGNKICFRRWWLPNIEACNWTLMVLGSWNGGTRQEWRNRFYFCYSQTTCTTLGSSLWIKLTSEHWKIILSSC